MSEANENDSATGEPSSSSIETSSVWKSTPFEFVVEGTTFYVHADLVSRYSKPLDRLMKGGMSEAQKGVAVLQEVGQDTFARFVEWAYQGHYTSGEVIYRPEEETIVEIIKAERKEKKKDILEVDEINEGLNDWSTWGNAPPDDFSFKKKKKVSLKGQGQDQVISSKDRLRESFLRRKATVRQESIAVPAPTPNKRPNEDYSDVFLSHAKLYVFADTYDISTLKTLALENLQTVLAIFTLYKERTGDIIALLKYIYAHTRESAADGTEDLRTLLTHYMGFEMETLMKDEDLRVLMIDDQGALLSDFFKAVDERV